MPRLRGKGVRSWRSLSKTFVLRKLHPVIGIVPLAFFYWSPFIRFKALDGAAPSTTPSEPQSIPLYIFIEIGASSFHDLPRRLWALDHDGGPAKHPQLSLSRTGLIWFNESRRIRFSLSPSMCDTFALADSHTDSISVAHRPTWRFDIVSGELRIVPIFIILSALRDVWHFANGIGCSWWTGHHDW